jgi:type IV secretion system protein VirD4
MPTDAMGSAAWSKFLGDDVAYLSGGNNLLLGRPVFGASRESVYGKLLFRRPGHMLSFAQSGSGKGVSLIIPNLLSYRGSMLVIDPKGENAWTTAKWRRDGLEQRVYIVDPWGEVNKSYGSKAGEQETIARLNPLSSLDPTAADYVDDVTYFADALVVPNPRTNDPHWDASAKDLIAGLIAYVMEKEIIADKTLKTVRELLVLPDEDLGAICAKAVELGSESVAASKLGRFAKDSKEVSGVFSSARTHTSFLDSKVLAQNMARSDFSFEELATGRATIYLVLPAQRLRDYGRWLRLMVSMAIKAVAHIRASREMPVLFLLDEFGTVGRLDVVENAYGLMRGFGIAVWAFLQDLNQLSAAYPESLETFIANSTAVTCYGGMDQTTLEKISKMLGTQTVQYETRSETTGTTSSQSGNSTSISINTSLNTTGRALLFPEEIRTLPDDLCIVLGRHDPILCRRLVYYEDFPFYRAVRFDPTQPGSQAEKIQRGDVKTLAALTHLARQRITSFESAKAALFPCGLEVERSIWGPITVQHEGVQVAQFWREWKFIAWAQEILPEGYLALEFVF